MKNKTNYKKGWAVVLILLLPAISFAQEAGNTQSNSYFTNAVFNTLLALIVVLLIIIAALGNALKNLVQSDYFKTRIKNKQETNGDEKSGPMKSTLLILFLLSVLHTQAQTATAPSGDDSWRIGGLDMGTFSVMLCILVFEASIIAILYNLIMGFVRVEKKEQVKKPAVKAKTILDRINASVDMEKEKDILLDHNYDGIRELDNNLPPWWKYGFYATIVFALIYLVNFHVTKTGDLQEEEYNKSIAQAKADVEAYMKTAANNVDETNVKMLGTPDIESGKSLFVSTCAACHGKEGQGGVGPNLTDAYWLHGGSITDIFKSIKYGWVDKGMKSWKEDLSPVQIAQLSSFIRSIAGSNPAGAKAAQGDLYNEGPATTDTTIVQPDTVLLISVQDSVKK